MTPLMIANPHRESAISEAAGVLTRIRRTGGQRLATGWHEHPEEIA